MPMPLAYRLTSATDMSSRNDTHYTDLSTGLKVTILKGGHNFSTWFNDLKHVARCKSLWFLFTSDPKQPLLAKPVVPCVPESIDARSYRVDSHRFSERDDLVFRREMSALTHQSKMKKWEFACQQWEKQQGKIEEARFLLFASVEPKLLEEVAADKEVPGVVLSMILLKFFDERLA